MQIDLPAPAVSANTPRLTAAQRAKRQTSNEAIELLRRELPKGSTLFAVLRHVSSSGMSRRISVLQAKGADDIRCWDRRVSQALDWKMRDGEEGVIVSGCGMDMGFHLIASLGQVLHGDTYAFKHRWA